MRQFSLKAARVGKTLGLVPTMGYLHRGHLSLLRELDGRCDIKAASIFVNPTQFGPGEDFERYPRDEARDLDLLAGAGCEVVFCPTASDMYPEGFQTQVEAGSLAETLCGKFRPGHFSGVATVVLKLFTVTGCSVAVFGLKDYQQAQVIRRMVEDFNLPVMLRFAETIREPDGLAMSSRNAYLSPIERKSASSIPVTLERARRAVEDGEVSVRKLTSQVSRELETAGLKVQYVNLVHPQTLQPLKRVGGCAVLAVACFAGKTRLIDNILVGGDSVSKAIPGVGL